MALRIPVPGTASAAALLSAILLPAGAASAQPADGGTVLEVPPVVVTATRTPVPVDSVASTISVVTAEEMERRRLPFAADHLARVPGLALVQSGPAGAQTSVFMRGTNSNHTLALLDGIEINDPSNPAGALDFGHMTTLGLDRIEVLRGPQSTLWGSDAIGGVVAFVTARGEGTPRAELYTEAGSRATLRQEARYGGAHGRFDWNVAGSLFRTDGVSITPARMRPAVLPEEADGYLSRTARARFGAAVTEDLEINLFLHHFNTDADNDAGLEDPNSIARTNQSYLRVEALHTAFDGMFDQRLSWSLGYQKRKELDSADPGQPFEASENRSKGRKSKLAWQGDLHLGADNTLTFGAEHEREAFTNDSLFLDQSFGVATISEGHANADDESVAFYVQDQFRLFERVSGTAGVRLDDHQSFGSEVTWRVAMAYDHFETGTRIKGSWGTGFKAPALFQRFGSSVFTIPAFGLTIPFSGNPALAPERSEGWDAGFEQTLDDGAVRFGATYYRNRIDGLIASDPTFTTLVNLGSIETWGVEAFAGWSPIDWLGVGVNYTWSRAEDPATGEEHFNRTPRHQVAATVGVMPVEGLTVDLDLLWVGTYVDRDRVAFQRIYKGGFARVDLAATYELLPDVTLVGRVDNLLDRDYEYPDGFQHPGIGVFGGVSARF